MYCEPKYYLGHILHDSNNLIQVIYGYLPFLSDMEKVKAYTQKTNEVIKLFRSGIKLSNENYNEKDCYEDILRQSIYALQEIDSRKIILNNSDENERKTFSIITKARDELIGRLKGAISRLENNECEQVDVYRYNVNELVNGLIAKTGKILSREGFDYILSGYNPKGLWGQVINANTSRIVYSKTSDNLFVEGNIENLERIIENLTRNAKQAKAEKVKFTFFPDMKLFDRHRFFYIACRDYGDGMDSLILRKCGREGFTTKRNGNGFGLSSTKKYANALYGNLKIMSGGIKKGAKVIMRVPMYENESFEQEGNKAFLMNLAN